MATDVDVAARVRISPWLARILRPIHTLFMPAFFRLRVRGRERFPASGPVLVAPTHRSRWDPLLLACLTKRLLRFMASHDEFVGVQGWFMRRLGAFAVNTRRPSPGTLKTCEAILRGRDVLVIFAEGSIFYYPPDQVHPLKPGTAWLALKVQQEMPGTPVRVLPVRIRYSRLRPKFRDTAEIEVREPILVTDFLDRPERIALRDLTAAIEAAMGDVVNTSVKEMIPARGESANQKHSYGRRT